VLDRTSLTLFHFRGIRIAVDWSWLLIFFFLIITLSQGYGDALNESDTALAPFAFALLSTIGFFGSIVLHEIGHALAATRKGIGISAIQLWIFGGIARMDREPDSPKAEFEISAAGPAVTLALVAVFYLAGCLIAGFGEFAHVFRRGVEFKTEAGTSGAVATLAWLAVINAFLFAFNLLPAFPMDGGRIARALIWWRTGDSNRATRIAASLGRAFGYLFIAGGLALALSGDLFIGIWLVLIGVIVNGAAGETDTQKR
jgi:Zn-dependent protease